jgi:hypothetical protein
LKQGAAAALAVAALAAAALAAAALAAAALAALAALATLAALAAGSSTHEGFRIRKRAVQRAHQTPELRSRIQLQLGRCPRRR